MQIFATLDADGAPVRLLPGQPFTTFSVVEGEATEALEVAHVWNALDTYGPEDLARFAIQCIAIEEPPAGQVVGSVTLSVTDGAISAAAEYAPAPVPQIVSRMQLKRALNQLGLLAAVESGVAGSGDEDLTIYWADTSEFHRDHPALTNALTQMGFTADQADDAFRLAATLT